jgi:quinol-cytochrome oxidoreductase complex cytochrome b subunit
VLSYVWLFLTLYFFFFSIKQNSCCVVVVVVCFLIVFFFFQRISKTSRYAESTRNGLFLCECTMTISTETLDVVVKTSHEHAKDIQNFITLFVQHMSMM